MGQVTDGERHVVESGHLQLHQDDFEDRELPPERHERFRNERGVGQQARSFAAGENDRAHQG